MKNMSKTFQSSWPLYALALLSLAGIGVSGALTQHFYEVRNGTSGFHSFCNINSTFNCDTVAASRFAEFALGLPISALASGSFLSLFILVLFLFQRSWRKEASQAIFGASFMALAVSIIYLGIMTLQLKTFCLLCLVLDGISLAVFLFSLFLKPESFRLASADFSKWKTFLGICLSSLAVAIVFSKSMDTFSLRSSDVSEMADSVINTPVMAVRATEDLPSIGPLSAPITIVEFSDFQCPFCQLAAFSIQSIIHRYPGQIRVVFKNYPLDRSCNPKVSQTAHPYACEAARAALCAHQQKKFEPIYEAFFQYQPSLASGQLWNLAKNAGIPLAESCMNSSEVHAWIARDIDEAQSVGVQSTPTFFINGHKMEGAYPTPVWVKVIDHLLGKN